MRLARRNKFALPRGPNFATAGDVPLGPHEVVWNGILYRQGWTARVATPRALVAMPKGQKAQKDVAVPGSLSDRLAAHVRANPDLLLTSRHVAGLLGVDVYRGAVILQRVARRGLLTVAEAPAATPRTGRPPVVYRAAVAS